MEFIPALLKGGCGDCHGGAIRAGQVGMTSERDGSPSKQER